MTRKGYFKKLTGKLTLIFALIAILCLSAFALIACGKSTSSDEEEKEITYTYTNEDTTPIDNMNFDYSTEDVALDKFPYTTTTWNRTLDNGAKTSQVSSGVVDISEDGWDALMSSFYEDLDFRAFASNKFNSIDGYPTEVSAQDALIHDKLGEETEITDQNRDELLKKAIIKTFETFGLRRPVRDGMENTKVYMLNNYMSQSSSELGFGTAQIITSSSSVTLEKGKYAEISVWILTQCVSGKNADGDFGANIRINNTINNNSQAQYRVSNIVTNGEWKQYKIYVKADDTYTTTFTLVFGLGYGSGSTDEGLYYTEGTAYFDSVGYRVLEDDEIPNFTEDTIFGDYNLEYGATDPMDHNAKADGFDGKYLFYDLSMDAAFSVHEGYVKNADIVLTKDYTKAKGFDITSETLFNGTNSVTCEFDEDENAYKVSGFNYSAYTVKIDSEDFVLEHGEYAIVNFKIKNNLSKLGSTVVTVSALDQFGDYAEKRASLITVSAVSDEYTEYSIEFKNNFADEANDGRRFTLIIEIGPKEDEIVSAADRTKFVKSGEIYFTSPTVATGVIKDEEADTHALYAFLSSIANKEQALYAGFGADYTEATDSSISYALVPSSGNLGEITAYPTNLENYQGIVANHLYVKDANGTNVVRTINTRSGKGDGNGNFAGLINTKYLDAYNANIGLNIANALDGAYTDDIQPLMIYNKELDHYGYVGNSTTIAAGANAQFTVKVRVVGDAKAYIYLVNVSEDSKSVLTFVDFKINGRTVSGYNLKYALVIDSTMMDDTGWATINFYIGNGANERKVRLEMWNGSRTEDAETASLGYVFFNDVEVITSAAFNEAERFADSFADTSTPLGKLTRSAFVGDNTQLYAYAYGETEAEQSYVWAKNDTTIYSIYNTIEKIEATDDTEEEDTEENTGCKSSADPSTFWLSFSSILLAVVLIAAIIALFIKNLRRRKGGKKKIQSHYNVQSRNKMLKDARERKIRKEAEDTEETEELADENDEVEEANDTSEEESSEQTLDDYVYGDVTDFGETDTNEEKPEEVSDANPEETSEDKPE